MPSNSFNYIYATFGSTFDTERYFALLETESFKLELKKDLELIKENKLNSDKFMEEHGNYILSVFRAQRYKIALDMWFKLLDITRNIDPKIYDNMHKGTCYFFTGIIYCKNGKWIEGFEWLDYAYCEDTKNKTIGFKGSPASWVLSFDSREGEIRRANDFDLSLETQNTLDKLLREVNSLTGNEDFKLDEIRDIVKKSFLDASSSRTLRSSWFTFLGRILDNESVLTHLRHSSRERCIQTLSNKVFIDLTLILETFLNKKFTGSEEATMGRLIKEMIGPELKGRNLGSENDLIGRDLPQDYLNLCSEAEISEKSNSKIKVAYMIAYKLRNYSHHRFIEEKIDEETYHKLYLRLCYAIFYSLKNWYN